MMHAKKQVMLRAHAESHAFTKGDPFVPCIMNLRWVSAWTFGHQPRPQFASLGYVPLQHDSSSLATLSPDDHLANQ